MPEQLQAKISKDVIADAPSQGRVEQTNAELEGVITKAASYFDADPNVMKQDIENLTVDYGNGILKTSADIDDTKKYIKQEMVRDYISQYEAVLESGEFDNEDPEIQAQLADTILQLKDEFDIDSNPMELLGESLGNLKTSTQTFFHDAGKMLSNEQGRTQLYETVRNGVANGVGAAREDKASFFDALAVLGAEAVFDDVPTGLVDLGRDIATIVEGGQAIPQRVDFDFIGNKSPFSGKTQQALREEQPAAAFIAGIVPFILQGVRSAGNLRKLKNSGKQISKVGAALRMARDEAAFEFATGSAGQVDGEDAAERMGQRGLNSAIAFIATLGIEGGLAGVRKIGNKMHKEGLRGVTKVQAVQEELMQKYRDILADDKPISTKRIEEAVEKYGIKPIEKKVKPLQKETMPSSDMKIKEVDDVNFKDKRGNAKEVATRTAKIAKLRKELAGLKKSIKKGNKKSIKRDAEIRKELRELLDAQDAKPAVKKKQTVVENVKDEPIKRKSKNSISGSKSNNKSGNDPNAKRLSDKKKPTVKKDGGADKELKLREEDKRTEQEAVRAVAEHTDDTVTAEAYIKDTPESVDVGGMGVYIDKLTAVMGQYSGLNRLRNTTPRLNKTVNAFIENFSVSKRFNQKANNRAAFTYRKFAENLGMDEKEAIEKYLNSGKYRGWKEGMYTHNDKHGTLIDFIQKYKTDDPLGRGEMNHELNEVLVKEVLEKRNIKRADFDNETDYINKLIDEFADPEYKGKIKFTGDGVPVDGRPKHTNEINKDAIASAITDKDGNLSINLHPERKKGKPIELIILHEVEHMNDGLYPSQNTNFKRGVKHFRNYSNSDFTQRKVYEMLEGTVSEFSDQELKAFHALNILDETYNRGVNLKMFEKLLGKEATEEFSYDAFTDAVTGRKLATINISDNPKLRKMFEDAGIASVKNKDREFVIFDYGDSLEEILQKVEGGADYFQRKFPELFEDGKLKRDLFEEEQNISFELAQIEKEYKLGAGQIGQVAKKLREQGYPTGAVDEVLSAISKDNFNPSDIRRKVKKLYVGAFQKKNGRKAGVNLDPINARRKQNLTLTKKFYRDNMNQTIDDMQVVLRDQRVRNTKMTDHERWLLDREEHILEGVSDMVNNRPGKLERILLTGIESTYALTGRDPTKAFKEMRTLVDSNLAVQSVFKLAGNVSGSTMNIIEALRVTADTGIQMPDKYFNTLHRSIKNPAKFVKDTHMRMARSKKYSQFYLEDTFDASVDTRYGGGKKGVAGLATSITESHAAKIGMMPFTSSIKFGKVVTYNIGEQVGKAQGLKGQKLDDFIFDFMSKRSQIQDLNVSTIAKNDTVIKSVVWLKNFMFRMSEYEIDAWTAAAGKNRNKDAIRTAFAFSVLPAVAFGVGSSPTLMLLNQATAGLFGTANVVSGGFVPNVNIVQELESGKYGAIGKVLSRGAVGTLTNISTRQMSIDPVHGLNQKPVILQEMENAGNVLGETYFNAKAGFDTGNPGLFIHKQLDTIEKYLAREVTSIGRIRKGKRVATDGVLASVNDLPIETNIPENERSFRAVQTAAGFSTASADARYAQLSLARTKRSDYSTVRGEYADSIAKLMFDKKGKYADQLRKVADEKGYNVTDKMIKGRLKKLEKTRVERYVDSLSGNETELLENEIPALFDEEN